MFRLRYRLLRVWVVSCGYVYVGWEGVYLNRCRALCALPLCLSVLRTHLPFVTPSLPPSHTFCPLPHTLSLRRLCGLQRSSASAGSAACTAASQLGECCLHCFVLSCASPSKVHFSPSLTLSLILPFPQCCSLLPPSHNPTTLSYPFPPSPSLHTSHPLPPSYTPHPLLPSPLSHTA